MKYSAHILIVLLIATIFWFGFLHEKIAYGATSTDVDAKITISVCGNGVAEGGEDCDTTDVKSATCKSLGYGGGKLTCNASCSYDTSVCAAPTATPQAVQESKTSTNVTNISQPQNREPTASPDADEATIIDRLVRPQRIPNNYQPVTSQHPLPAGLKYFDINHIGKILMRDLPTVVTLWVEEWRIALKNETNPDFAQKDLSKCDVNRDKACDIKDFSILMSYIQK